ncbi:hypothetical protein [Nocardioides pakistanensis]
MSSLTPTGPESDDQGADGPKVPSPPPPPPVGWSRWDAPTNQGANTADPAAPTGTPSYPPVLDKIWNFLRDHWWWAIPVFFALAGSSVLFYLSALTCGILKWSQHSNRPLPPEQDAARAERRAARRHRAKELGMVGGTFALLGLVSWALDGSGRRAERRQANDQMMRYRQQAARRQRRDEEMDYLRDRWTHEAKQREKRERGRSPFNW